MTGSIPSRLELAGPEGPRKVLDLSKPESGPSTAGSRWPGRPRRGRPNLRPYLPGLLTGLLLFAAFPPIGWAPLAAVAFVPLLRQLHARDSGLSFRRRFRLGHFGAAVFFVALLHWMLLLANDELTIPGIMLPALFVLAAYLALFFGFSFALAGYLGEKTGVAPEFAFPFCWTLADIARSSGETAFPWGSIGYSLAPFPVALQMTAWTGYWVLPLWLTGINGLVAWALRARAEGRGPRSLTALVAAAVLAISPLAFGGSILSRAKPVGAPDPDGLRVTLLQPNTAREIKWKPGYRRIVIDDLLAQSRAAVAADSAQLLIWPETAAPMRIPWEPELLHDVERTVREMGVPTLVGTLDARTHEDGTYEDFNAAIYYGPEGGELSRYYKMRLVPFGEITPCKRYIPWLAKLDFGQSEFTPGETQTMFLAPNGAGFACLICFEGIFPDLAREAVQNGAGYLVNITNDFWFGKSAGPIQHAHTSILRAVENRTPLLRAANSGLSFFVDPYGRTFGTTELFTQAHPSARIAPGRGSFFSRHGDWITPTVSLAVLLLAIFRLGLAAKSSRNRAPGLR